jgi:hypothetical protein
MRSLVASAAAVVCVAIVPAFGAAEVSDRVTRDVSAAAAARIWIDATIAHVTLAGSNRTDARVEIGRRAPGRADFDRFPAIVDERPDGLHVSVVQAGGGRDARLNSTIRIEVPMDARIEAVRVAEGAVRLARLRSACDVDLGRGAIEGADLAGRVRLESGLGSVDVRGAELTPGGMMRLRVFNGPLRVQLAHPPANARILALTFNGSLASDIPLAKKDRFGPRFGEATLGNGDPVLSMDVVKGDITLTVAKP